MGFDIVHLNLHKTFATPHGGGGPGAGPVGVTEELRDYLPTPTIGYDGEKYYLNYNHPRSIGRVSGFYGNFEVLIRAFTYILSMGSKGLNKISDISVLNANYIAHQISKIQGFTRPFHLNNIVKHECVISCSRLTEDTGITAKHVAKRLLDFGVHAPTMYFPPIVDEALMIEPTETESLETLDRYIDIFKQISHEAYTNPQIVMTAPHSTSIPLVDEVKASHPRTICLTWRMFKQQTPI